MRREMTCAQRLHREGRVGGAGRDDLMVMGREGTLRTHPHPQTQVPQAISHPRKPRKHFIGSSSQDPGCSPLPTVLLDPREPGVRVHQKARHLSCPQPGSRGGGSSPDPMPSPDSAS